MPAKQLKPRHAQAKTGKLDASAVSRYQQLVQRRRTGRATDAELDELAELSQAFASAPEPPEFREAMLALAKDRQLLRESMERIERLMDQAAVPAKAGRKYGRKFAAAAKQIQAKPYTLDEAIPLVQKIKFAKFDETVEVHMRLGVDPTHADQMVRGTVVLPNGLGKNIRVLAIVGTDKMNEAKAAGADFVGGEEMVAKIQAENWIDYEVVIATPDMMRSIARLGRVLGPRGLMPNPKTGTVTTDIGKAVKEAKAGTVEFRVDKTGVIHAPVGKASFSTAKLLENAHTLINAVVRAKPAAAKGKYVKSVTVCSAMGPDIPLDTSSYNLKLA